MNSRPIFLSIAGIVLVVAPNFGDYAVVNVWAADRLSVACTASLEARHEDDLPDRNWAWPNFTYPGFSHTTTLGYSGTFATTCSGIPLPL